MAIEKMSIREETRRIRVVEIHLILSEWVKEELRKKDSEGGCLNVFSQAFRS